MSSAETDPQPPVSVVGHRDIPVRETESRTLDVDVYRPPDATPGTADRPIVAFVHGGAWSEGTKGQFARYALAFASGAELDTVTSDDGAADEGYVAVELTYRLRGEAPFPAPIVDVHAALDWLGVRASAFGGDPDRLAIVGHSAGGHLAALASLTREHPRLTPPEESRPADRPTVDAVIGVSGVYDFDFSASAREDFAAFLADPDADRSLAAGRRLASPTAHVESDGTVPPTLLLHGGDDEVVAAEQTERYADVLERAGAPVEREIVPDGDHVFLHGSASYAATRDRIAAFVDEHV